MRRWSAQLFTLLGIRVEVHVTFLLLLGLVAWQGYEVRGWTGVLAAMISIVLVFGSVLLHELGHCLAARHYGIPVPRILLLPIGGMAEMARIPRDPRAELVITAAGPAVNFALGGLLYLAVGAPEHTWYFSVFSTDPVKLAQMLMAWNVVMGLFNLLPVFPMDGGRIFRALLALRLRYLDATRIAVYTAKVLVVVGIALAILTLNNYLLAALFAFIWFGGEAEYRQVCFLEKYTGFTIGDVTLAWHGGQDDPALASRPALSARWPLEIYARLFEAGEPCLYPVYDGDLFIGVVDTARLDAILAMASQRRRLDR